MGKSKNKSKSTSAGYDKIKINQEQTIDEEEQLPIPWKISLLLVFLAIIVISLFQSENDSDIMNAQKAQNNQEVPDPESLPPSMSKLYIFKHGAISTDSQACSDIARNMLIENANVFDVTISSLICNGLTNMQSMGIYGGFLLSAFTKDKTAFIIDAQMTTPKNFPSIANLTLVKQGPLSIAVFGGFLKGVYELYKTHASMSWKKLIEPSIELCKNGFILTKHLKDSIETNERILQHDEYMKSLFVDEKSEKIKRVGSKIINWKHCNFLKVISNHDDEKEIFSGKIEELISNDLDNSGSILTINDIKTYKLKIYERELINLNEDFSILIPKTSAILVPSILKILLKYEFNSTWFKEDKEVLLYHRVIEVFKHVFALRSNLGDSDYVDVEDFTKYILSNEYAEKVIKSIDDDHVRDKEDYGVEHVVPQNHGTSHISIVAENGDTVSVTSSINYYFGAGMSGKETGAIFNNGMDDFSYPNRDVNYFGLKETSTNYPEYGKRALSSLAPVILIDRKTQIPALCIGAAGGSKILTALSIALLRFISGFSQDLKEIVDAPRFHHQMIPNVIEYEYGVTKNIIYGLKAKGHETKRYRHRGTIINAITKSKNSIYAISDYRKDSSGVAGY